MKYLTRSMMLATPLYLAGINSVYAEEESTKKPNILFVFADQWRAQATGYAGDPNLQGKTPNLDTLALESVNLTNAVSTIPVCTPFRASLLTGQYPLTHGLFLNDVQLNPGANSLGKIYKKAGYDTGYVGKWHLDGSGRGSYIPKERRQGFDYWKVLECTHNYNKSHYYSGDDKTKRTWKGYDAIAQTQDVQQYIKDHAGNKNPFIMVLSWGGPHNPYQTAPEKYKAMVKPEEIKVRPNVPPDKIKNVKKELAGYYAHIVVLDDCMGELMKTIDDTGIKNNTILVFTSDHGDMLGSQGEIRKQRPWDESVCVPFLIRYPDGLGKTGRKIDMPFGTPDILPTLLGLSGIPVPLSIEGQDYSKVLTGVEKATNEAALIQSPTPFQNWHKEFRGIRTRRYTFVRDLKGPWLLYDNQKDPYQMKNLVKDHESDEFLKGLAAKLSEKLKANGDEFKPAAEYIEKWGYKVNKSGAIPYKK